MAKLSWSVVLKTAVQHDSELVLLAGGMPPLVRFPIGFSAGSVPPLTNDDLAGMVDDLMPYVRETKEIAGFTRYEVTYDNDVRFRVSVFGGSAPFAIAIVMIPFDAPPDDESRLGEVEQTHVSWRTIPKLTGDGGRDLMLVRGMPPLVRSERGLYPLPSPSLDSMEINAMIREVIPSRSAIVEVDGYRDFTVSLAGGELFRGMLLGGDAPFLVVLMRLPQSAA
jgi:Tfp pilus assembly pilus retraction ATPase PilT